MRAAFFTGGTLGAGHLMRGLALGRAIERRAIDCELRLFVPVEPLPALQPLLEPFDPCVCPIDPDELFDPESAAASELARALLEFKPDVLIVDLFWAPLVHIRPLLQCEAWLIVRSCPPSWLDGVPRARFDSQSYARIIGIEPLDCLHLRESISPIVVCNPDEARSRDDVCERWGIDPACHIVAITHAGLPGEIDQLFPVEAGGSESGASFVIRSDLHERGAIVPLAPWLPAVDQVYSAAGYNSYWEARWMGYAHKTVITAMSRQIDSPLQRIRLGRNYTMQANGADELAMSLVG